MKRSILLYVVLAGFVTMSCKDDNDSVPAVNETQNSAILTSFSAVIAASVYTDLAANTTNLYANVLDLVEDPSDVNLAKCQASWKSSREVWEQSEAHLFGPVATEEIDPRIDTWPVNFVDLDAQLASDNEFTEEYVNNLDAALKGFHPIEYLLFGKEGNKKGKDLSARELEYLEALAKNLGDLTTELAIQWMSTTSGNYQDEISKAGDGSTAYATQRAAFEEIVNAMAGICDEVANGKLAEPYDAKDPSLEESPFAGTSIIDFTNNIKGVKNVYTGKFKTDGAGLDDLVKTHNLSLDADINAKIDAAITALGNITVPFGEAINDQSVQVQNAMDAINDLHNILEEQLLPFVQQHSN